MFVKIGPYRRRWSSHIHYDYMNKKYNHDWTDTEEDYFVLTWEDEDGPGR